MGYSLLMSLKVDGRGSDIIQEQHIRTKIEDKNVASGKYIFLFKYFLC